MYVKSSPRGKTTNLHGSKNTIETFEDDSLVQNLAEGVNDFSSDLLDQMFGSKDSDDLSHKEAHYENRLNEVKSKKVEHNLFDFKHYHEKEVVAREVQSLQNEIKKAVSALKHETSDLVKDAEKLSMEPMAEKAGIYHIRLLEVIINLLRIIRMKVGESRTWMDAMITKKKKRGSLFAALSKKQGTQYSMSQEISTSRSVQ